jgi:SAM-dependent methyltransferase
MNKKSESLEKTFVYQDGAESKLFKIFEDPSFDEYSTYRKYTENYALYYHLSPKRKNLVRWIDFDRSKIKILELGAGCGAITSYFTSLKSKPQIVAVEGSKSRARLIKTRCKKADNLKVITKNIQDFEDDQKYDFVTLIGVLEYSGRYIDGKNPFEYLIKKASKFLRPDGVLLIAIENQFGHKYLAGFDEDHYAKPFEGISGYPNYNGIRTFDKKTLHEMIKNTGLYSQKWLYPFPDYKMPKTILSDNCFKNKDFDWLSLLNLPTTDHNSHNPPLFNERTFLKKLASNIDASVFMNSFLVCATKTESFSIPNNILAAHMQFSHNTKFQEMKNFILEKENKIIINHKKFDAGKFKSENITDYHTNHENLLILIIDSWQRKNYKKTTDYLLLWLKILQNKSIDGNGADFKKFSTNHLGKNIYAENSIWLPGKHLDLILRNCLLDKKNHQIKIIDQEWDLKTSVPIKLVVDRAIYYLQRKMMELSNCKLLNENNDWDMPLEIHEKIPAIISKPEIESVLLFDYWFHKGVREGNFDHKLCKTDIKKANPSLFFRVKQKSISIIKTQLSKLIRVVRYMTYSLLRNG